MQGITLLFQWNVQISVTVTTIHLVSVVFWMLWLCVFVAFWILLLWWCILWIKLHFGFSGCIFGSVFCFMFSSFRWIILSSIVTGSDKSPKRKIIKHYQTLNNLLQVLIQASNWFSHNHKITNKLYLPRHQGSFNV